MTDESVCASHEHLSLAVALSKCRIHFSDERTPVAHPFGENIVESPRPAPEPELEHASGNRRDRGLGFFAR